MVKSESRPASSTMFSLQHRFERTAKNPVAKATAVEKFGATLLRQKKNATGKPVAKIAGTGFEPATSRLCLPLRLSPPIQYRL